MSLWSNRWRSAAIAASAVFTAMVPGGAMAQLTDAGTSVANTFTLDYQVSGVAQTQITNDGVGGNAAPTTFTVDRVVDLLVQSQGDLNVSPGANGQELVFQVRNDGNDRQAYSFELSDLATDGFDAALTVRFYTDAGNDGVFTPGVDDAGAGTAYTSGSGAPTTDVNPDETLWVIVSGNIPLSATDGQFDDVILLADTLDPSAANGFINEPSTTPGAQTDPETGSNNIDGVAQNVLADGTGTAASDADGDGAFSATARYNVVTANLTASKTVAVIATDASTTGFDCATDPVLAGDQFAVPGACIEYLITVANDAGAAVAATDIDIDDLLPDEIAFLDAVSAGFTTAGTLTEPALTCTSSCQVSLTGASLDPGDTGTITIRATVR